MEFLNSFNPYFLASLFFAALLTNCYVRKQNKLLEGDTTGKLGCFSSVLIFSGICILLLISSLFTKTLKLLENIYTSEKYNATIIKVDSFEVEIDDKEHKKYKTMYSPVVKFKPKNIDTFLIKDLLISSGEKYRINQLHKVSYNKKTGEIYSAENETLFLFIMALVFSFLAILAILYIVYLTFLK